MSKLLVDALRHTSASSDAVTLDSSGNITVEGNLTVDGTSTLTGAVTGDNGGLFSAWAQVYDLAQSSGADGGTFTSGAMRTRTLQTEEDPSNIVSLSSNQFTLGAGTYIIRWSAPAYTVSQHVSQLYNITDSAVAARGSQAYSYYDTNNADSRSVGIHRITISGDKAFEIQHQAGMTANTHGFGPGMGGQLYKFTIVEILKEA